MSEHVSGVAGDLDEQIVRLLGQKLRRSDVAAKLSISMRRVDRAISSRRGQSVFDELDLQILALTGSKSRRQIALQLEITISRVDYALQKERQAKTKPEGVVRRQFDPEQQKVDRKCLRCRAGIRVERHLFLCAGCRRDNAQMGICA